ncbi:MAG: hypothetical protein KBB94_02735 [Legionellaceae bacterium]|nr:hypothetical protein [Legionellaceae bacterium]MBP9775033.1 hypothetical protein [Legionellaceae bacterium]
MIRNLSILFCLLILSGCSVYRAAQNDGIAVSDIKHCDTKICFVSHGMKAIDHHMEKNGHYVEIYRAVARKSGFNYVRSAGHAALDVATIGLWEIAATPIEGALSNNRGYIIAKVTYANKDCNKILSVETFDAKGKRVK